MAFCFCLKADLHGTILSHATSLPQAYDSRKRVEERESRQLSASDQLELNDSASYSSCTFISQFEWKPLEICLGAPIWCKA